MVWYGMAWCPSYPLGRKSQSMQPDDGGSWTRAPTEHAQTVSVPSALVRYGFRFHRRQRWPSCELAPFLFVLSCSPPARRDAELHGRPVGVEADQLELALEVVPVGVCPSSAARCVSPQREELAREPRPVHASHVPSPARSFRLEMTWSRLVRPRAVYIGARAGRLTKVAG
jgi:hypothetical protein